MIINYNDFINEGKYYNETLNPKFWNEDGEINGRIKGKLLTIAHDFYSGLELDVEIQDIQLTGSLANYNYSDYSDFDIHILIDYSDINDDIDLVKSSLDNIRFVWNTKHNITIKGHEVELYVQDVKEPHNASGLYSLMDDEWIREPKFDEPEIDEKDVALKTKYYQKEIDKLEELSKDENIKMDDLDRYFDYSKRLKTKIHQDRKDGLETKAAEFSVENLVFKELRNSGHFGKLIDIINELYDKQFIQ